MIAVLVILASCKKSNNNTSPSSPPPSTANTYSISGTLESRNYAQKNECSILGNFFADGGQQCSGGTLTVNGYSVAGGSMYMKTISGYTTNSGVSWAVEGFSQNSVPAASFIAKAAPVNNAVFDTINQKVNYYSQNTFTWSPVVCDSIIIAVSSAIRTLPGTATVVTFTQKEIVGQGNSKVPVFFMAANYTMVDPTPNKHWKITSSDVKLYKVPYFN